MDSINEILDQTKVSNIETEFISKGLEIIGSKESNEDCTLLIPIGASAKEYWNKVKNLSVDEVKDFIKKHIIHGNVWKKASELWKNFHDRKLVVKGGHISDEMGHSQSQIFVRSPNVLKTKNNLHSVYVCYINTQL
jgi:hypothetical protein